MGRTYAKLRIICPCQAVSTATSRALACVVCAQVHFTLRDNRSDILSTVGNFFLYPGQIRLCSCAGLLSVSIIG